MIATPVARQTVAALGLAPQRGATGRSERNACAIQRFSSGETRCARGRAPGPHRARGNTVRAPQRRESAARTREE